MFNYLPQADKFRGITEADIQYKSLSNFLQNSQAQKFCRAENHTTIRAANSD